MQNIHILPTDKPSRLYYYKNNLFFTTESHFNVPSMKYQNIYITSDEEIKDGDWMIRGNEQPTLVTPNFFWDFGVRYYKIILTTDQDLIEDGVQKIDDEFLEWFVKNPSCESVEIGEGTRYEDEWIDNEDGGEIYQHQYCCYKIIIPERGITITHVGKPKQEKINMNTHYVDFSNPNADKISSSSTTSFKQERMYSEEDMIRFAEFVATHPDKNRNVYGEMLHAKSKYDGSERTIDLLEQFKKK